MSATYGMSGIDPLGCGGRCSQDARTDRMMSTSIPRATLGSTVARMFPRLLPRVVPPGPTPFFDPAIVHYEVVENNENNTRHVLDQAVAAVGCPLLRMSGRRHNHERQLPWSQTPLPSPHCGPRPPCHMLGESRQYERMLIGIPGICVVCWYWQTNWQGIRDAAASCNMACCTKLGDQAS